MLPRRMLLFLIQSIILLAWHTLPALCANGLGQCQKSGCRTSPDGKLGSRSSGTRAYQQRVTYNYETLKPSAAQRPRHRLQTLVVEWITVFSLLRFFLYVRVNGCRPVRRRLQAAKESIASSFDCACSCSEALRRWAGAIREFRGRGGAGTRMRRPLSSARSAASLGSLADLVGWDEYSEETGGSAYDSSTAASDSLISGASYDTSYYTESGSETTPAPTRNGHAAKRESYASFGSSVAVGLSSKKPNRSSKSRSNKGYESDPNDSYTTGYTNDSYTNGSEASGSILSKFMDYLSANSAERNTEGGRGGEVGRPRPSSDDNGIRYGYDRPLQYDDGRKRRSTVDTHHENRGDLGAVSQVSSSVQHKEGMRSRQTLVGQGGGDTSRQGAPAPARREQHVGSTKTQRIRNNSPSKKRGTRSLEPTESDDVSSAFGTKDEQFLLEHLLERK